MRLFSQPLHVGRPNLGDRDRLLARIEDMLDRRWLTNQGPYVHEFETRLASYLGVKHCLAVSNATVGLEVAIRALDLAGEVIVPSFTFPATAHALSWLGITPVFCDVDPETHTIDPASVEQLITPRTTGILGVHVWGNACDSNALATIAQRHGLKLLFDAAHALGCTYGGQMIGNLGDAEVFSFHATKFVNAAEGGAITTNDDEIADRLRRLRNFGLEDGEVADVGTNAKMCELSAAMGLTSLESIDEFVERNAANYGAYAEALADVRGLQLISPPRHEQSNYQYVVVDVDARAAGQSRDAIVAALHAENVLAKRYFNPGCHRMPPYRALHVAAGTRLPHTERLCERLMQLPTGTAVSPEDIARIGGFLRRLTSPQRRAA